MGQDLAGATFGAGGGTPLVFIHGFPLDGRMWECQQAPFSEERRVLVPDLRGFGRSPLPEKQNTIEDHARDLALFLEMHNVMRAILCGFSMGGYVALAFASLFPWKMAALVLADTRASADPDSAKAHRTTSAQRALSEGMCFLADEMLFKLLTEETLHAGEGELPVAAELELGEAGTVEVGDLARVLPWRAEHHHLRGGDQAVLQEQHAARG